MGTAAKEKAQEIGGNIKSKASKIGDATKAKASELRDKASDTYDAAKEKVHELVSSDRVALVQTGYFTDKPFVLAIILLIVGPFMLFYGRKQIDSILYIATAIVFFYMALFVFQKMGMLDYIDKNSLGSGNLGLTIFAFAVAICAAGLAGHTSYTFKPLGKLFLGALAGYFFGCFIYNLFFIFWNKALVTLVIC